MQLRTILGLGLLMGCPSEPPIPTVELGTGVTAFEPLEDGDEVLVVLGPQGSYHIDGSLRLLGIEGGDPDDLSSTRNPTVEFAVEHGEDSVLDLDPITQGLEPAPADAAPYTHELLGRRLMLLIADDDELDGETLLLEVTVRCVNGLTVRDAVSVQAAPHPMNL